MKKEASFLKKLKDITEKNKDSIFFVVTSSSKDEVKDIIIYNNLSFCFDFSEFKGVELSIEGVRILDKKAKIFVVIDLFGSMNLDVLQSKDLKYDKSDKKLKVIFL